MQHTGDTWQRDRRPKAASNPHTPIHLTFAKGLFTELSALTLTGAVVMTYVVVGGIQAAFAFHPGWLALAVSELVCVFGVILNRGTPRQFLVALFNGFLVFSGATGANAIIANQLTNPADLPAYKNSSKLQTKPNSQISTEKPQLTDGISKTNAKANEANGASSFLERVKMEGILVPVTITPKVGDNRLL